MNATRLSIFGISFAVLLGFVLAGPQDKSKQQTPPDQQQQTDTNARPLTEKEKKLKAKRRRDELASPYKKWLNEDVSYIITDEERAAFNKLQTDEEREQFIEQFWLRRDPTPDTEENEFKEEHYRRIAYANERFASGIPGWKTDRGRIYITFGPPDEIEDHSSGGFYERPPEEGGGETSTFPFQQWRYRYIDGIGNNVIIEFVDTTMSGEFRMTSDPSEKDALLYVPNAGLTLMEQMGMSDKTARFNNTDGTHLGVPFGGQPESMNEFTRLETFAKLQRPPAIKLTDLESDIKSKITYNILPMKVLVNYFPVTDASVLVTITVQFQNKDLQFQSKEGVQQAKIEILGKITTMTRRPVAHPFDDPATITVPQQMFQQYSQQPSIYQKVLPLTPGTYRLEIDAKDVVGGNFGVYQQAITVPRLDPDKLNATQVVLADIMERVPMKSIGTGSFVIGDTKVRPRMGNSFKSNETVGIYFKVYNFETAEGSNKPNARVSYELVKTGTTEKLLEFSEDVNDIPGASASQVTVQKLLNLEKFKLAPGSYTLRMKVIDKNRNQELPLQAQFTVT